MSDENSTTKSIFGWKGVIAAIIFGVIFMGLLYLAMANEPDYMPSQQRKKQQEMQQQMQQNSESPQQQNVTESAHSH